MAIATGSIVTRAQAGGPFPNPSGQVVNAAAPWEVAYADGSHDAGAATAGLTEMVNVAAIGADPVAGQIFCAVNDVNQVQPFQAIGQAATAGVGGTRYIYGVPVPPANQQPGITPRGLPWALQAAHIQITGKVAQ